MSMDIRPDTPTDGQIEDPDIDESHSNEDDSAKDDDRNELAVKAIPNKKITKNRSGRPETHYVTETHLVKWEDDDIEPSWEPLKNLHCRVIETI